MVQMASTDAVIHAYRHLFRSGLHAVQYSKSARYYLRDTLRTAFREGKPEDFNSAQVANTISFLDNAAREAGIEHKVVKNILHVRYWQRKLLTKMVLPYPQEQNEIRKRSYRSFEDTIQNLNRSLNMCLR